MIHLLQQQRLRNGLISILFFCFCGSRFTHALLFATPTRTCLHLHPIALKEQSTDREPTAYYQRSRQERSSTRDRKPRFYWKSPDNLSKELHLFWEELNVTISSDESLYIPNEHILNYFKRNDIRAAIYQFGGRENVALILDAIIIPGKWKEAMQLDVVRSILPLMEGTTGIATKIRKRSTKQISAEKIQVEVASLHQVNQTSAPNVSLMSLVQSSSATTTNSATKAKEFWSKESAIKQLYIYLEDYKKYKQRPTVFMPPLVELKHEGYTKLFNSLSRFQKLPVTSPSSSIDKDDIVIVAGLVPFKEWRFFESQLLFLSELNYYLKLHHNGSEDIFPELGDVLQHGHDQLHDLVRIHGGKTLLAHKLDMKFAWDASSQSSSNQSWGPFSVRFAVQLLDFIRTQYLQLHPPLSPAHISMPSEKDLLRCGQDDLAKQVITFGGYENVARRLGLEYFDAMNSIWTLNEERYREAKLLWKERHSTPPTSGRKTREPWSEDRVVKELLVYVQANNTQRSLPPNVMPRFSQFDEDGRGDLKRAISKFGGKNVICKKSGLIPIEMWQDEDQ